MNKADLIEKIAADCDTSKALTGEFLNSFCNQIQKTLKKGDKVTMVGFGTWSITKRKARQGRNPRTGEPIKIKAKKVVKFKAGKGLSEKV